MGRIEPLIVNRRRAGAGIRRPSPRGSAPTDGPRPRGARRPQPERGRTMFRKPSFVKPGLAAALGLALAGASLAASGQQAQAPAPIYYTGATLIDVVGGRALEQVTLVVADGKIQRIETSPATPPAGATVVDLSERFVAPGLIDAHVHIATFDDARRALLSGVTTARSMGVNHFFDVGLRELARAGQIDSPEIVAAGYHVRPSPAENLFVDNPELGNLIKPGASGEDAVRRLVRTMAAHGVNVIKVTATDRAGLPETDPRKPLYGEAELRALVDEANAARLPVAAHIHGAEGGHAAVAAGVRSVEHGTYLKPETLKLMAERGTYFVPTMAVVVDLTQPGGDYDSPILQIRGRHMLTRIRETVRLAHQLGVPLAAGTDTTYAPNSVLRLGHELIELNGAGLSPAEALRAGTSTAARLLGVDDHTGRLEAGLDADFIVVDRNPLNEVGALQDPLMVVNNGKVVLNRKNL